MDINVSDQLKNKAAGLGLCEEWTNNWGRPDKDELVDKYIRGIDFAIKHDFPSTSYMKEHFNGIMQKHGVFVDENIEQHNPSIMVANGKCKGYVNFDNFGTGRLYIRHDSNITVKASGLSKIFISTYDNCKLNIDCTDEAIVYVYKHRGNITYSGNVLIREQK